MTVLCANHGCLMSDHGCLMCDFAQQEEAAAKAREEAEEARRALEESAAKRRGLEEAAAKDVLLGLAAAKPKHKTVSSKGEFPKFESKSLTPPLALHGGSLEEDAAKHKSVSSKGTDPEPATRRPYPLALLRV